MLDISAVWDDLHIEVVDLEIDHDFIEPLLAPHIPEMRKTALELALMEIIALEAASPRR